MESLFIYYNCFKVFNVNLCWGSWYWSPFPPVCFSFSHISPSFALFLSPFFLLTMMEFLLIFAYQIRHFHPCFQNYYYMHLMHLCYEKFKIELRLSIFFNHSRIKLEIKYKRKTGKNTQTHRNYTIHF